AQNSSIPTVLVERDQVRALAPDWTRLTFAKLPRLTQSGSLWGRNWSTGQKLDDVLTLGDFQNSFKLQDLNLYAISLATQTPPKAIPLNQFRLLQQQSLNTLVNAIPDLDQYPVSEIKPIADLLNAAKPGYRLIEETLPELLRQDPSLGALSFQSPNSKYTLEDIPGLLESPLQAFDHWQDAKISDIPGLGQMPWNHFPDPPSDGGMSGVIQILDPSSQQSNAQTETISGSDIGGYKIACRTCAGISFSSPSSLQGKRWISGAMQWVRGGAGAIALLNNSYEPTGRNVFGAAFKVVISEVTPKEVQTALYFRLCQAQPQRDQIDCSPYAVGSVPFLVYHSGDAMLVGDVDSVTTVTPQLLPVDQALPEKLSKSPSSSQNPILEFLAQAIDKIKAVLQFSPRV
ncbi:hypothetical protein IQ250_13340, partial [Pseudanabaenaceae cyanobacterium LEGE 13415]|nr:hypothetical protein [Pseudanabaenaceae cyanobacterium LEGE 13415]